jgi:hypothetical protein
MIVTRSPLKTAGKIITIVLLLALPIVGWSQRWNLYDYWRLRGYEPSETVASLASDTAMNDKARRLFYVYHPELKDKTNFSEFCQSGEKTIVLGCYISGSSIYLYSVTDERLHGIMEVTAAHEMLHAAYDRLSGSEMEHLNNLLRADFSKVKSQRVQDTIEEYRKNGADVDNELHSILATEIRELSPELETYYQRYFTDRLKVVAYSEKYEQAFTERKQKVEAFDARLESLKNQIESLEADLQTREQNLQSDRKRLDGLLAERNIDAYNAGVAGFNAQVSAYNSQVNKIRGLIDQHNTIVAERNAIAEEESELVKAIDSRPSTIQSQ